jgi:DNA-binding winged helix-turn-helix (wHTH) protein/tetratricopeptide (TPR) repeat protein
MSRVCYEFGPFRLDPVRRRLLRDDRPVALTPKAFDTLLALVEQQGQVVEKDALMKAVWGDTIVEEVGLARNVSSLRKVLGELPDEHRYIVTVPGRGYSFVEQVRTIAAEPDESSPVIVETHTVSRLIAEHEVSVEEDVPADRVAGDDVVYPAPDAPARIAAAPRRSFVRVAAAVAAIAAVAIGASFYLRSRPALTERDSVLIADFVNSTGDPAFDRVLKHGLEAQLEQSPFLNLVPDSRARETLRMMGRPPGEPLTLPLAREVSLRHGIKAAVGGDITALGQQYVLTLEAINVQTGEVLARAQTEIARKEDVLRGLSEAVRGLRQRLGESLSSIQQFYTPIEQATTASLEALQAYSMGREAILQQDSERAIRYYQRAVEIDPGFAIAWNALADLHHFDPPAAEAQIARAFALRDRTSELERIRITLTWHEIVTRDLDVVIEESELFRRRYPHSWRPYWALGSNLLWMGQNQRALPHALEVVRLDPTVPGHHFLLGEVLARLDRLDEARAACRQARARPGLLGVCGYLLETQGPDRAQASEEDAVDAYWQTVRAARNGQWQRALQLAARARDLPARDVEVQARLSRHMIVAGALVGDCGRSWPLEGTRDRRLLADTVVARALCGDAAPAREFIERHETAYPRDTLLHALYLPTARAALALAERRTGQVAEALQGTGRFAGMRDHWPTWLRGEAYLRQPDGAAAAAEFKRILEQPGLYLDSPLLPLAHLGLARAAARAGDGAQSRSSYEDFFEIWKDADADLPVLVAAREEHRNLP